MRLLKKLFKSKEKSKEKSREKSGEKSKEKSQNNGILYMDSTFQYPNMIIGECFTIINTRNSIHAAFNKLDLKCTEESYVIIDEMIEFGIFSTVIKDFESKFSDNPKIHDHFGLIRDRDTMIYMLGLHSPMNICIMENKSDNTVVVLNMIIKLHSPNQLLLQHYFCIGIPN